MKNTRTPRASAQTAKPDGGAAVVAATTTNPIVPNADPTTAVDPGRVVPEISAGTIGDGTDAAIVTAPANGSDAAAVVVGEVVNPLVPGADPATAVDDSKVTVEFVPTAAAALASSVSVSADEAQPRAVSIHDRKEDVTIVVVGPSRGRWRAGRHFTNEAVSIPMAELSSEDLQALNDDPLLAVSIVTTKPAPSQI